MAADSGQYTPETLQRRLKIAEQLTKPVNKPIYHWLQGMGEIGEGALGGYMLNRAEKAEKEGAAAQGQALLNMLGGGQSAAPTPASPAPEAPAAPPPQSPGPMADGSLPRGLRNNNPLNIEAGNFTQSQPGFSGSDGRFARFDTPDAGVGAANKLLDVYQNKHGLNTPAGIIGRWAPAGDGNNVSAYAQAVAQKLGINPNDPIPPEMRPQLIAAMGQHENGRPIGDVAKALMAPQQMAQATPQAAPAVPGVQPQGGDQRAQIAKMLADPNPYVQRMARQMAAAAVQKQLTTQPEFQRLNDEQLYEKGSGRVVQAGTGFKPLVDPKERAAHGIPADDKRPYQVGPGNKLINPPAETRVNIDQKAEGAFETKAGQLQAERLDKIVQEGMSAKSMIADMAALKDIGSRITTGKTAEIKAALGPYAEALGVKIDELGDLQAYESIVQKLAPQMRVPGSGATSDFEMRGFLKALPGLGKTPEGNELIGNVFNAVQEQKTAAAEIAGKVLHKEISRAEGDKMLRDLPDPMALWRAGRGKLPTAKPETAPDATALKKKYGLD